MLKLIAIYPSIYEALRPLSSTQDAAPSLLISLFDARLYFRCIEMSMPWGTAFKRAFIYVLWLIVWGIIGGIFIGVGVFSMAGTFVSSMITTPEAAGAMLLGGSIFGLVMIFIGYVIIALGSVATFIRLIYSLSLEASLQASGRGVPAAPPPPIAPAPAPTQLKYCANCGKGIPMSAKYCPYCQAVQP